MEYLGLLLIVALMFGVCFLADKGFTKLFRNKVQHRSGKAVRLNKRYGAIGIVIFALGVAAVFMGLKDPWVLIAAGAVLVILGVALVVYYMTFGIFYDEESFVLTTFGKKSTTYYYKDIEGQQLYVTTGGGVVIEVYMRDGRTFQLQSNMKGVYDFMDKAFFAWLRQTGRRQEDCDFYDPENSCWFPKVGV